MQRRLALTVLTIVPIAVVIAAAVTIASRGSGEQEYETHTTVLESPQHGPELCLGGVATSLPPQCGGVPITNWDWDEVDDDESRNGTTWVSAHVRGTYDGERFTLTAPPGPFVPQETENPERFQPACNEPDVVDEGADAADWEQASEDSGSRFTQVDGLIAVWVSDPRSDYDGPFVGSVLVRPGSAPAARDPRPHHRRGWSGAA